MRAGENDKLSRRAFISSHTCAFRHTPKHIKQHTEPENAAEMLENQTTDGHINAHLSGEYLSHCILGHFSPLGGLNEQLQIMKDLLLFLFHKPRFQITVAKKTPNEQGLSTSLQLTAN